jgi:hypothetical protein
MICTLTARRLKRGTYDDFRAAWMPSEGQQEVASRWNPVYVCRDVNDENVVVAFGMFQGTVDELRRAQQEYGYEEEVQKVSQYVDDVLLDGAYEVVEEITPESV